jgi:hypothetical protein
MACGSADATSPTDNGQSADSIQPRAGGHVGAHGMVLFGSEKLYLSHIPLYDSPHNIQVVVEVKVASGVPDGQAQFGTKQFTLKPRSSWSLDDLASGALTSLSGTIYMGDFEAGGTPAFRNVTFDVKRVVLQRALSHSTPASPSLDYIAVGTPTQPFLVHVIDAAPSFDQIVAVKLPQDSGVTAANLESGTPVRIEGRPNEITKRLKPQAVVNGIRPVPAGDPPAASLHIEVLGENSCLPGPDFFGDCPAAQ